MESIIHPGKMNMNTLRAIDRQDITVHSEELRPGENLTKKLMLYSDLIRISNYVPKYEKTVMKTEYGKIYSNPYDNIQDGNKYREFEFPLEGE